jgi:hypothetical protein
VGGGNLSCSAINRQSECVVDAGVVMFNDMCEYVGGDCRNKCKRFGKDLCKISMGMDCLWMEGDNYPTGECVGKV